MTGTLYRWPSSAAFGRTVPKTKFYEHGNIRTALRQKFVDEIQRITWAYKLADSTIRLKGSSAVPEIQVFAIETKKEDVSDDALTAIDKSVQFPILFEITRGSGGSVRLVAAYKTLGGAMPKLGPYFSTGWLPVDAPRAPLPTALDLPNLYEALIASLLPVATRRGESVSRATDRMEQVRKLEREIAALDKKLRNEPQLNRRIELRRRLVERNAARIQLITPDYELRTPWKD
jgi:hypothetical protein